MAKFLTKQHKEDAKLVFEKIKMKAVCPKCGRKVHFYAYEKKDKQLCQYCGRYVFKSGKDEFIYRLKEKGVKCD